MKQDDYRHWVQLASKVTLLIVTTMIVAKAWAWLSTGSASMLGSLTDSLLDISASLMNFFVIKYALMPPDEDHRFGHGKAESLAGLGQAAFVSGSAILLFFHGLERVLNPVETKMALVGIWVSIFAIVATFTLVLIQRYVVARTGSIAVKADAMHYKGDLLLNFGVMLALLASHFGWFNIDGYVAVSVAFYLLINAIAIARESTHYLMDKELPSDDVERIKLLAIEHPKVHGLHELRTRQSGQTKFIQFHLELDRDISLIQAHQIASDVEQAIKAALSGQLDILIHQDIYEGDTGE